MHDTVTETNHQISFVYSPEQWDRFKKRGISAPKVPSCNWKILVDLKTFYLEHPDGSFPGSGKRRGGCSGSCAGPSPGHIWVGFCGL